MHYTKDLAANFLLPFLFSLFFFLVYNLFKFYVMLSNSFWV